MLVGMDTHGIIQGVVMDYNSEPYGYFSVDPPEFVAQFKDKSMRDPFLVGKDIAAVSRASITMNGAARALRDASRTMAKAFLTPDRSSSESGHRAFRRSGHHDGDLAARSVGVRRGAGRNVGRHSRARSISTSRC